MNEPRQEAGAVAVNGTLYVFCGVKGEDPLSSVEKMINAGGPQQGMSHWQMINFTEAQLFPRWSPCISMLTSTEIVIMGGNSYNDDDELSSLGDVYIFNMQTEKVERRVQNFAGLLQFHSVGNNCA